MAPKTKKSASSRLREAAAVPTATTSRRVKQLAQEPLPVPLPPAATEGAFERAAAAFAELRRSLKSQTPFIAAAPMPSMAAMDAAAVLQQPPPPPPPPPPPAPIPTVFDTAPANIGCNDSDELPAVRPDPRHLSELGLPEQVLDDGFYRRPTPLQTDAGLDALRRNVKALYDDARSHIHLERDAAHHVVRVQAEVGELQRAFRHLAEVAVEELEELRQEVEQNATAIEAVRSSAEGLQPMKAALAEHIALTKELTKAAKAQEAERDKRVACLEAEVRELRHAATSDREALEAAVSTVRDLGALLESHQSTSDASLRTVRETLAAIGRRQAAFEIEIEALGAAFRRAAVGAPPASAQASTGSGVCGAHGPAAATSVASSGSAHGIGQGDTLGTEHQARAASSPLLPRARLFGLGLDMAAERHAPPSRSLSYQGSTLGRRPGGGVDPVYAKALAEARRELSERSRTVAWAGAAM